MGFNSVCERARKCDKENREWRLRQTKPVSRWYLDLASQIALDRLCVG